MRPNDIDLEQEVQRVDSRREKLGKAYEKAKEVREQRRAVRKKAEAAILKLTGKEADTAPHDSPTLVLEKRTIERHGEVRLVGKLTVPRYRNGSESWPYPEAIITHDPIVSFGVKVGANNPEWTRSQTTKVTEEVIDAMHPDSSLRRLFDSEATLESVSDSLDWIMAAAADPELNPALAERLAAVTAE